MRPFKEIGYDGLSAADRVPEMVADSEHRDQAVAFALCSLKGLMEAVRACGSAPPVAHCVRRRPIRPIQARSDFGVAEGRTLVVVDSSFESLQLVLRSADFSQELFA